MQRVSFNLSKRLYIDWRARCRGRSRTFDHSRVTHIVRNFFIVLAPVDPLLPSLRHNFHVFQLFEVVIYTFPWFIDNRANRLRYYFSIFEVDFPLGCSCVISLFSKGLFFEIVKEIFVWAMIIFFFIRGVVFQTFRVPSSERDFALGLFLVLCDIRMFAFLGFTILCPAIRFDMSYLMAVVTCPRLFLLIAPLLIVWATRVPLLVARPAVRLLVPYLSASMASSLKLLSACEECLFSAFLLVRLTLGFHVLVDHFQGQRKVVQGQVTGFVIFH